MKVVGIPSKNLGNQRVIALSNRLLCKAGIITGDTVVVKKGASTFKLRVVEVDTPDYRIAMVPECVFNAEGDLSVEPTFNNDITIGCDPEFLLLNRTFNIVDASAVFSHNAQLGSDACLGELRPSPGNTPDEVVSSIKHLIGQIPTKTKLCPVSMSYYRKTVCGFHVHIGLPAELVNFATDYVAPFVSNLIKTMDYFVGIPAALLDNNDKRRLANSQYGRPGDYRLSRYTVEYRTPGGFHLRSPSACCNLMAASYVIAEDVLGRAALETRLWTQPDKFFSYKHFSDVYGLPTNYSTISEAMTAVSRTNMERLLEPIRLRYERLFGFQREYGRVVEFLSGNPVVAGPYLLKNWLPALE